MVCKGIVFIMKASKDFNAKYSLVRLLTFVLFQNRLLLNNDSAGSRIKEEGMCVNSCLVALLRFYEARLSLVGCYLFVFIDEVSTFFVYTDDCGLCCKSSTESFRVIIFWRNIEMADFDVLEEIYKNVLTSPLCKNYTRDWFIYCNYDLTLFFPRYDLAITKYHSGSDINVALIHENEVRGHLMCS